MKRKTAPGWTFFRKSIQAVSLLFFIAAVVLVRQGQELEWLIKLPIHLDPLLMISSSIASRKLVGGIFVTLLMLLLTFVFGRFWCGLVMPVWNHAGYFPLQEKRRSKDLRETAQWQIHRPDYHPGWRFLWFTSANLVGSNYHLQPPADYRLIARPGPGSHQPANLVISRRLPFRLCRLD